MYLVDFMLICLLCYEISCTPFYLEVMVEKNSLNMQSRNENLKNMNVLSEIHGAEMALRSGQMVGKTIKFHYHKNH